MSFHVKEELSFEPLANAIAILLQLLHEGLVQECLFIIPAFVQSDHFEKAVIEL